MYIGNLEMKTLTAVLVLGIISSSSYALDEQELCDILPEKATFRHLTSCSKYFTCSNGKPIEGNCLGDMFFDKDSGKCKDRSTVQCDADLDAKCVSNSIYLADLESCQDYHICINGKAKRVSCPNGSNFNQETSSCAKIDDYFSCKINKSYDICKFTAAKVLLKSKDNCKKYQVCSENGIVERSCPESLWYNSKDGRCDTEENSSCGVPEPEKEPSRPEFGDICGTPSRPFVGSVHDGLSCRGYYECAQKFNAEGKQIPDSDPKYSLCSNDQIFNERTKKCTPRQDTKCRFDRCDGMGNKYINIENDGCHGYAICEKNKEIMRMKCPNNFYFDEKTQDCVNNVVKYLSCSKV